MKVRYVIFNLKILYPTYGRPSSLRSGLSLEYFVGVKNRGILANAFEKFRSNKVFALFENRKPERLYQALPGPSSAY